MHSTPENTFDYVIAGGGMAGLSLAYRLNRSSLNEKRVLIIDKDEKKGNDHTWCFWEQEPSLFESVVFHKWKNLWFHGTNGFSKKLEIGPFEYKMIRSDDFYRFVKADLGSNKRVAFLKAEINGVEDERVRTSEGEFSANEFVFDSFNRKTYDDPEYHNLLQHFLGWTVRCEREVFEPESATLFDFRVSQKGDCRFIYVLPYSTTEALVEFTVFSSKTLEHSEYESALESYLVDRCGSFERGETESGVIPMSNEPHIQRISKKVIRIGTAGGYVKPSTGYSFKRTQRRIDQLVKGLEAADSSKTLPAAIPRPSKWKRYLDSVFLDVLENHRHPADDIFTNLFRKNSAPKMLSFLDEQTSLAEDVAIMRTVPIKPFAKAALLEFFK